MLERSYAIAREISSEGNAKLKRTPHGLCAANQCVHIWRPQQSRERWLLMAPGGSLTVECCIWNRAMIMRKIHIFISKILLVYGWLSSFSAVTKSCTTQRGRIVRMLWAGKSFPTPDNKCITYPRPLIALFSLQNSKTRWQFYLQSIHDA